MNWQLAVTLLLVSFLRSCSVQHSKTVYKIGEHVEITNGYYNAIGCKGVVTRIWETERRVDRSGRVTEPFKAGYWVYVTCENGTKGEFTFTPDFLKYIK